MGFFNFFGESEHRVFNYRPVYYDQEKEERRRKFGAVDGSLGKEQGDKPYSPGSYIRGAWRDGNYQKNKNHTTRVQVIIGIITMILVFAVLYFIAKFYTLL